MDAFAPSTLVAETGVCVEIMGSGSLCALARSMIADGADPAVPVVWTRRGVPVFKQEHQLGRWAEREVDGRTRLVIRKAAESTDLTPLPASREGYDAWWPGFEDELAAVVKTRTWPTVGEIGRAAEKVPVRRDGGPRKEDDVDPVLTARAAQLRAWLGGKGAISARHLEADVVAAAGVHESVVRDVRVRFAAALYDNGKGFGLRQIGWDMHLSEAEVADLIRPAA